MLLHDEAGGTIEQMTRVETLGSSTNIAMRRQRRNGKVTRSNGARRLKMPHRNHEEDEATDSALSRKSSRKHLRLGYGISPATAGSRKSLQMSKIGGRTTTNSQLSKRGSSCSTAFATRLHRKGVTGR